MEFSVSYNGDIELIERLKRYNTVSNIYGGTSTSVTGGGRSAIALSHITREDIEKAVAKAHASGIGFNYLINSSCMGNKEFTTHRFDEIIELLDWLKSIKVDWVTVAIPYVIEVCRRRYPTVKIHLSTFAMVDSIERAKYFDGMGVDEITVRDSINRNFRLLENIQKHVKCTIQVMVNQTCLYQCPYQFYHSNIASHASQTQDPSSEGYTEYCMLQCTYKKFDKPANIIKAGWIRPEDLLAYEAIGINKFKITDRGKSTEWLMRVVKAYHERKYAGNLADILNIVWTKDKRVSGNSIRESNPLTSGKSNEMYKLAKAFALLDINIENSNLDGFIERFNEIDCRLMDCDKCKYCERVAEKALSFPDKAGVAMALEDTRNMINGIIDREG